MRPSAWLRLTVAVLAVIVTTSCSVPYSNPPEGLQEADLVGTWEARYAPKRIDCLIIMADGTFKQIYRDYTSGDYTFETPSGAWSLEYLPDGRVRIHLEGARYYVNGIKFGEQDGMESASSAATSATESPFAFYDPFGKELVYMPKELSLNVQTVAGKLILHHMWTSSDRGFAVFGGDTETFQRIDLPNCNWVLSLE